MLIFKAMFWIAAFILFWAMIGYPISLAILDRILKKENIKDNSYEPTVTIMVVAHNEEKVIEEKLENIISMDYPNEKIDYIIASDCSTDNTDKLIEQFISDHPEKKIRINKSIDHLGKTNAQNEAQKLCASEILIMTDANSIFNKDAVKELVSSFSDPSIAYVSGQLRYSNATNNETAKSENFYWKLDLMCRRIESGIKTITAGNGAIYAVRNADYRMIPPIESHDSSFPVIYALEKKRAIYNQDAIAYEKAGEIDEDEFKRKVRMNRIILNGILPDARILNIFSYGWFTYFYFGHRTCRYLLWIMHLVALVSSVFLAVFNGLFWKALACMQLLFYLIAIIGWCTKSNNRIVRIVSYYCMTVLAQWRGVINIITGNTRSVWEKANSTR